MDDDLPARAERHCDRVVGIAPSDGSLEANELLRNADVSIRQLHEDDFPDTDTVARVLARTALKPQSLVLAITEGMLADKRDANVRRLQKLKLLGLRIAIDDCGTRGRSQTGPSKGQAREAPLLSRLSGYPDRGLNGPRFKEQVANWSG